MRTTLGDLSNFVNFYFSFGHKLAICPNSVGSLLQDSHIPKWLTISTMLMTLGQFLYLLNEEFGPNYL